MQSGVDHADRIRALRDGLGLTQTGLAELLGVSFATVNRWENRQNEPSTLAWEKIVRLEEQVAPNGRQAQPQNGGPVTLDFAGKSDALQLVVEAERLRHAHLYNPAFASEISRIDPLPHQRIAVYERMLPQPRLHFLLADDAGAGKTIMSGLYIREMLSRRLLRRILIVPPAGLVGNWQRELRHLFNLDFRIVTGADARSGNPFVGPESDRLIVSVDTLAADTAFGRLAEEETHPVRPRHLR